MSKLEKFIDRVVRDQPALRAPGTLEARVFAEIERRAALPWWHRSFAHWPVPMRVVFVTTCAAVIWASLSPPMARLSSTVDAPVTWAYHAGATVSLVSTVLSHAGAALARSISPLWLYGAALGVCGLYVLFAGLCATTYRTLYVPR
ncbi:MAG: hypothetical protein ACHQIL_13345 [Steroidobacterales bacterium]